MDFSMLNFILSASIFLLLAVAIWQHVRSVGREVDLIPAALVMLGLSAVTILTSAPHNLELTVEPFRAATFAIRTSLLLLLVGYVLYKFDSNR